MNIWRGCRDLVLAFSLLTTSVSAEWGPGTDLPDLTEAGLEGILPDVEGKVVMIDFWASWCVPCKATFPVMEELYTKYKDKGLQIIAISVDESRKGFDRFIDRMQPSFPVAHAESRAFLETVKPQVMPTSFLVDRKGVIQYMHLGWGGKQMKLELETQIVELLEK